MKTKLWKRIAGTVLSLSVIWAGCSCTRRNDVPATKETKGSVSDAASESVSGNVGNDTGNGDVSAGELKDNGVIVVGYTQIGSESDWRIANTESLLGAFPEEDGFYLIYENAQQVQEKQIKSLRNFILQGVNYIILNPIVENGWDTVLQEAKDARIPVIVVDREVQVSDESLYTCWIGADFEKEGRDAGEWLERKLEEEGRAQDTIRIAILLGTEGSTAEIGRTEGFSKVAQKHSNWEIVRMEEGEFTQAKGRESMSTILAEEEHIDVLLSENDNMTFGAIEAIHEAGQTCGPEGDITVISFDAVRAALEAMEDGYIDADFECNPLHGPAVRACILALEAGEEVEKIQYMEESYFDASMDIGTILETRAY